MAIKKLTLAILLVMISLTALSQSVNDSIAKMAVLGKDTVAILTIPQVKAINKSLIELREKTEIITELNKSIDLHKLSIKSLEEQNHMLCETESALQTEVDKYQNLYGLSEAARVKALRSERKYKIFGFTIAVAGIAVLLLK